MGFSQMGPLGSQTPLKRNRLRVVTKYAAINTRFTSFTTYAISTRYHAFLVNYEMVNRKVYNIRPVWMNAWKSNTGGPSLLTNAEDTSLLGTITVTYAYEMPKANYADDTNLFGYSTITVGTTAHVNYGGGSGCDGLQSTLTIAPGEIKMGNALSAADVTFNAGASQTFPKKYSFFMRLHNDVPSGEYPVSEVIFSWGAGAAGRGQYSATSLSSLVSSTGRFSASANADLGGAAFYPCYFVGEVDDSADSEPYVAIGFFGNSLMEGPTSSGTDPQTSTTTVRESDAGYWRDNGWAHEWARSIGNTHGVLNVGCSSWSMVAALQATTRRDMMYSNLDFCDVVVINFAVNDFTIGRSLAQMQADTITMVQELQRRGKKVVVCTGFPYGTSNQAVYRQYTDWCATLSNTGANAVWNPLPDLGDNNTTWWQWKSGYSSDNVHPNNTTGMAAVIASWNTFWQANKAMLWS